MNKEYTMIGENTFVRDEKGHLSKRESSDQIEEILKVENRIEYLENMIKGQLENREKSQNIIKMKYKRQISRLFITNTLLLGITAIVPNLTIKIGIISYMTISFILQYIEVIKLKRNIRFNEKISEKVINQSKQRKKLEEENLKKLKQLSKKNFSDFNKQKETIEIKDNLLDPLLLNMFFSIMEEEYIEKEKIGRSSKEKTLEKKEQKNKTLIKKK